jgi:hypothetical protein
MISPTNRGKRLQRIQQGLDLDDDFPTSLRETIQVLAVLLGRLEVACLLFTSVKGKVKAADQINQIYLEFFSLTLTDLKKIINFFELTCPDPPCSVMTRTVSEDPDIEGVPMTPPDFPVHSSDIRELYRVPPNFQATEDLLVPRATNLRINIVENESHNDEGQQEVECNLWTPTSDDMNSYLPLRDDDLNDGRFSEPKDEFADDLRRAVGSFDLESVQEEREGVPSWDDDDDRQEDDELETRRFRPILGGRRSAAHSSRPRKGRFWRRKLFGGKLRQVTAE